MEEEQRKRLFFGMEVRAPWPEKFPFGRLLDPEHRHLTLAFLGSVDYSQLEKALVRFPQPPFTLGFATQFDQSLFLPPRHPRVVAWHLHFFDREHELASFQKQLVDWLLAEGFKPDMRHSFTPHVTLCRAPFRERGWRARFVPIPALLQAIHLYESVGNLKYQPIWSYPLLPPFEEFEHTADIAYRIRGTSYDQLFIHAALALAFNFPPLLPFIQHQTGLNGLEDVIMALNHIVGHADGEIGCPFKAVSFHSKTVMHNNFIEWEMIVDV
jgi:2'-5' RNA ligase